MGFYLFFTSFIYRAAERNCQHFLPYRYLIENWLPVIEQVDNLSIFVMILNNIIITSFIQYIYFIFSSHLSLEYSYYGI